MGLKDKDIELWKAWKKNPGPATLGPLLTQMNGVIQKECNRWQGVLARDVLVTEGERLAKEAFQSYDPKAGAALSTHLTNYLQKLSRLVYTHQNVNRIPEYQTLKIQTFNRAHSELESNLGRPPNSSELAGHLMWSQAAVEKMRKEMRRESVESRDVGALPVHGRSESDAMVDLVYHDLNPLQRSIFEHSTGYGGASVLSGKELTDKLKITQGVLSYEKTKIVNRIKTLMP